MLRLQKGKVPQHQFVTESCGTRPETRMEKGREMKGGEEKERKRVFTTGTGVCVWPSVCAMSAVTSAAAFSDRKEDLLQRCEWAE